jgi:hypothetical protein
MRPDGARAGGRGRKCPGRRRRRERAQSRHRGRCVGGRRARPPSRSTGRLPRKERRRVGSAAGLHTMRPRGAFLGDMPYRGPRMPSARARRSRPCLRHMRRVPPRRLSISAGKRRSRRPARRHRGRRGRRTRPRRISPRDRSMHRRSAVGRKPRERQPLRQCTHIVPKRFATRRAGKPARTRPRCTAGAFCRRRARRSSQGRASQRPSRGNLRVLEIGRHARHVLGRHLRVR